jgi:hypothetical protein
MDRPLVRGSKSSPDDGGVGEGEVLPPMKKSEIGE